MDCHRQVVGFTAGTTTNIIIKIVSPRVHITSRAQDARNHRLWATRKKACTDLMLPKGSASILKTLGSPVDGSLTTMWEKGNELVDIAHCRYASLRSNVLTHHSSVFGEEVIACISKLANTSTVCGFGASVTWTQELTCDTHTVSFSKVRSGSHPTHPTAAAFFRSWLDSFATFHFGVGLKPHPPSDHSGFATLTKGRVGGKQNSSFQAPLLEPKWHQRGTCALSVTKTLVFVSRHAHGFLFKSKEWQPSNPPHSCSIFPKLVGFICHLSFWCGSQTTPSFRS